MALCVRRLVLAATLAAVVALLLCTSSAPVARAAGKDDFTPEQRTNTLKVLQAFGVRSLSLEEYIKCYSSAVSLWMDSVDYAGTLPEMPAGVDYKHVVITQLDFSAKGQRLSGTLPASWSSMTSLMSLWLEGCERVTGTLPASWSSMKALSSLNLHGTQVSGSLPPQWSSMASLTLLDLQGAKVSGSLPSEWREMKSAEVLQLQDCDLSGSLPSSWSAMPKLREVLLSGNHFCGCVPQSWTSTQRIAVTIEDEHKGRNCKLENKCRQAAPTTTATPTATPTLAPETECEVDGCEVCEGDSAARCARCREGYFLTSEKTCRANGDGGVAAGRRDSTHRWSCALCCEALVSVPSLPCRRNRAATTAATLPRRTVPPDADAGPAELTSAAAASCRDAEACATTGDADALLLPAPRLDRPAVGWAPLPWRRAMSAGVVRLPHPRHSRALLCFVVRDPVVCAVARPRTPTLPCPAYASSPLLWEVRAHAPPSGFARSWLVKGRAVPSTVGAGELLAARSLDLTFSALHELLGDAQRCDRVARTFMPAAGLHRAGGMAFSARATATAAGCEAAAPLSAWSGADGTHVGCGGPHGWTADPRSRPAASSMCSATPHRWAGWARAAAARPLLLRGCVGVPESDGVLRRLCEAREVGGSVSAQTASCDAPADSRHGAHHRPSESVAYVPVRLHAALAVACGLADPAAAPACSPTAAAKPRTEGGAPWAWRGRTTGLAMAARRTACAEREAWPAAAAVAPDAAPRMILYAWDEEWVSPMQEGYLHQQRLEQVCFAPLSAYGMVPGSYCDPLLYNTKSTSPFRWHVANVQGDIVGHWYMDADELFRIKDWQPRNPDDPLEMFPRPPQMLLRWDESVDEHGNRAFRYRYDYDMMGPTGKWEAYPRYPFSHLYHGGPDQHGRAEGYGFQQGHLLRCDEAEEEVLRRIMEGEDREWEMVKRTEAVQEPWSYPGKIRPRDFEGAVERAKARFRERVRHGKETDPSEDPEYDLAQASEYVEPRDGRRAEWRHLWASGRKPGESLPFQVTFNDGLCFEENEGGPPAHPAAHYEATPKGAPHGRYEDADAAAARAAEAAHKAACEQSLSEAMERHRRLFGDTSGEPSGPRAPLPTGCRPMRCAPGPPLPSGRRRSSAPEQ
ncbi:hypothetical protein CGC21_27435 [Leishmania donovani]|uniref:Uncharacterized protein n=1 Tax=Leishmania donovani TaxID=5661 RepID=A0A504Y454_LEIDO|nr:hypothetical protein CGC21_27435 [Leishmania donovani]